MNVYDVVIQNKEVFKAAYAALIVFICLVIVLKTHKLFKLSSYTGIRYFRNAFFFFGLGFFSRYFLKYFFEVKGLESFSDFPLLLFEFFVIMAGFFLLYSLIWKRLDFSKSFANSSLLTPGVLVFYMFAIIIVILDYFWQTLTLMFLSQVIVFLIASIMSFNNTLSLTKKKNHLSKLYFVAMITSFLAWVLNAVTVLIINWEQTLLINIYILNMLFFLFFLYGVFKALRGN